MGIVVMQDDVFKYANEGFSIITGYSVEEIMNWTTEDWVKTVHPEDLEKMLFRLKERTAGEKNIPPFSIFRIISKSGRMKWIESYGKNINFNGQSATYSVILDITDKKESEEKFRLITENANDMIAVLNEKFIYEYINNESCKNILGFHSEELIGKSSLDLIHPDDLNLSVETFRKGLKTGEAKARIRALNKSGEYIWLDIKGKIYIDSSGNKKAILISRDITDRVKVEQDLKESEEKYRNITEQSLMAIVIMQDNMFKYVNEGMAKLTEYSIQEIMNWTPVEWAKTIYPEDLPKIMTRLRNQREGKVEEFVNITFRIITKSGQVKWVDAYGKSISINNKIAAYSALQDITEKKNAEEKLKESEEKFRQISEQALLGIAIIQDGQIKYINDAALSVNEYTREEALSWKEYELFKTVHPGDIQYMMEKLKEYDMGEAKGMTRHFTFRVISKSGKVKWIEQTTNPMIYQGKNATVNFSSEITARVEVQEKLKEAFERETFFKNLFTHDINNVLNNIQASLSLFTLYQNNPERQEEIRKIVNILKEQVVRGTHLVSNIRQLSEIEEGKLPLGSIDAAKVLEDAIKLVQEGFQTKIIDVNINSPGDSLIVQGSELLINVFENILNNAVKYNEHSIVEIIIRISKEHDDGINYMKFEFIDNGIGIDDIKKGTIFKEGYKKEKGGKGLGFGLSLVKKIIENYNGKIWVEDKLKGEHKKGSNFVILIPQN